MKLKAFLVTLVATVMMLMSTLLVSAEDVIGVEINETNFPDSVFREYISTKFDLNSDGWFSEAEISNATYINLTKTKVADLTGIENFVNLTELRCSSTLVADVDFSSNIKLQRIRFDSSKITEIDVSMLAELVYLDVCDTEITSLNVSANPLLEELYFGGTGVSEIDLSNNANIIALNCGNTNISNIDVSMYPDLFYFDCAGIEKITSFEPGDYPKLERLVISGTGITSLDVSKNTALGYLDCRDTAITTLDISNNPELWRLHINRTGITSIDVTKNTALTYLDCTGVKITSLDVSKNTALQRLYCKDSKIKELDLSANTELVYLDCRNTGMTGIDISNNASLVTALLTVGRINCVYDFENIKGFDPTAVTTWTGATYADGKVKDITGSCISAVWETSLGEAVKFDFYYSGIKHTAENKVCANCGVEVDGTLRYTFNKNVTTGKWVNAYSQEYEENVGYGFDEVCDWSAGITTKAESVHSSISGTLVGVDTDNIDEDTLNAISRAASGYKADPEVNFYVDLPAGTYKVTVYAGGLSNNNTYNLNRIFINGEEVVRDFATDPWNADIKSSNSTLLTLEDLQWTKRITLTDDTKVEIKSYNPAVEAGGGRAYLNAVVIEEAVPGIEVNETNFPDAIFREYVSNNFDTDLDGVLSEKEIENADRIMLDETGVADLTGIEYFTYLKNLHCFGCIILTKLDISKNVALESLNCQNTSISELDVSNNTELLYLECGDNNIGTLDVSNNTKLIKLSCSNTGITKLDISKNTALEVLYCDKNGLTKLDVSKNVALKELLCNGNQLTSLDVSTNTALETFSAANNKYDIGTVGCVYDLSQIASLDLTKVSKWTNATYADGKLSGFRATGKMTVYYTYDCGNDKKEQFGLTLNYTGEHNYVNGVCADCGALEGLLTITEDDSYVYVEGDMNIDTSDPLTMSTFKFYDASGNEVATLELRLGLSYTDTRKSGWLTVDGTTTIMKYAELHYEERKGNKIVISKEVWDSYFGDDVVKCKLVGSKQIEELDIEFDAVWDETSKPGVIMWNKVDSENLEYYMVRLYCNGTIYRTITVSNSSKYDFSQYINESGTYTVEVIAVFNKDLGVKTVMSDAFVYTRPEEELSASAKVWWAAKEGSTTPTIINWEPVPGAAGYSLKFYIEGKSGSYMATVYNTDELLSSFDLSNKYSSLISKAEAGAVLKCEIKALSGDITVVANADDDAVAVSGEYVLAETVEEEIKATVEQTTTDTIIEDIDNVGVDSMADAMQNNEEVLNKVEEVEKDFAKDNNVEVLPPTVEHPEVEAEDVKVVGAALNAASGSSIRLGFEKLDKKEEKHLNEKVYETVIQVDISLKDNEQDVKGKLKAPITITMKPPKGINKHKLVVLHYLDNGDIERIYPKLNDDGTITFSVTSFSAFVFANLVTYDEGVSDTTLPDVAVTPDEPDTPVVPDEPEKPNTPVVPDDEEDDYNYEYDPKDAIENRFAGKAGWQKVSGTWYYFNANGELKTGWVEDTDGKWYYMDEETGKMQTGWLKSKKSGLWYYMDTENGDMKYGGWLCDPESGRWYYLDANGAMCTSWILVDNKWYLLDTNGAMCTGWNLVNGEWYLLGSDGAMLTGWQTVGDKEYYLDELGKCLMNTTTPDGSKVDETGAKIE